MQILIALGMLFAFMSTPAVDTVECTIDPLTLPLFGGTPVAEVVVPVASPAPAALTEDEAEVVLQMYAACISTGEPSLVWAMFTPNWFADQFADSTEHYQPAFELHLESGQWEVAAPLTLVDVVAVEPLPDGRMAVTATFASGDDTWTDKLVLAYVDGQWLIDDVELLDPAG